MESALREGGREPGLRLIETILWDGAAAPRWPLHLARLQRSAGLLGWSCPVVSPKGPDHPARLRLTLDAAMLGVRLVFIRSASEIVDGVYTGKLAGPFCYGEGKVEAIDKDGVIISHGPIPSLKWGPMTMGFKKPGKGLPRDLRAGSRIRFEFVQQGNDYVLQNVTPMPVELTSTFCDGLATPTSWLPRNSR